MSTTIDLDSARDRLVDSLSSARDVTRTAVKEDIAPAVVAAVGAAREASGPAYAEAASRASDAVSALRGTSSDVAKNLRSSDLAKSIRSADLSGRSADIAKSIRSADATKALLATDAAKKLRGRRAKRRRWPIAVAVVGGGAAVFAIVKSRRPTGPSTYVPPTDSRIVTPPAGSAGDDETSAEPQKRATS